jgi:hypothetical protein
MLEQSSRTCHCERASSLSTLPKTVGGVQAILSGPSLPLPSASFSNMAAPSTSRPPLREITTPNARPLAPIFTLYKRRAVPASSSSPPDCFQLRTPPSSSPLKHIGTRKRLRVREDSDDDEDAMSKVVVTSLSLGKRTAARRKAENSVEIAKRIVDDNPFVETSNDCFRSRYHSRVQSRVGNREPIFELPM